MNRYEIIDNGHERYEVEAENALKAITKWMETYHNPEVIELYATELDDIPYQCRLHLKLLGKA